MDKQNVVGIYNGILAFKRKTIIMHGKIWMNFEDIFCVCVTGFKSQIDKYCMFLLTWDT